MTLGDFLLKGLHKKARAMLLKPQRSLYIKVGSTEALRVPRCVGEHYDTVSRFSARLPSCDPSIGYDLPSAPRTDVSGPLQSPPA